MAEIDSRGALPGTEPLPSGAYAIADRSREPPSDVESRALVAIAQANQELRSKTENYLKVAVALLIEQRDRALVELEVERSRVERERASIVAEQDAFIAFLTEDHQKQLGLLEQQLAQARTALERQTALTPVVRLPLSGADDRELQRLVEDAERRIAELQEQLENAYREMDESRKDGWRLQEERDEAIRATDDLRIELLTELDRVRDEAAKLELDRDEANRKLEDARDEAREEQCRLIEELESRKAELDERRDEVRRLRQRLEGTGDFRPSRPPPPAAVDDLELARAEAKAMRKQLVETKRELARVTRELELVRGQRGPLYRPTPAAGPRSSSRTGTTMPGIPAFGRKEPADEG